MPAPRVYNRHHGDAPPDAIYIGRGSAYGNRFVIGEHGSRDDVIKRFECEQLPDLDVSKLAGKAVPSGKHAKAGRAWTKSAGDCRLRRDQSRRGGISVRGPAIFFEGQLESHPAPSSPTMPLQPRIDVKRRPCPSASSPNRSSTASPPAKWSNAPRAWSRNWWKTPSMPAPAGSTFLPMVAAGGGSASPMMATA